MGKKVYYKLRYDEAGAGVVQYKLRYDETGAGVVASTAKIEEIDSISSQKDKSKAKVWLYQSRTSLLVSKINGIPVYQVGASKLEVKHKYADTNSPKTAKTESKNTKKDLGRGEQTYTFRFHVYDKQTEVHMMKSLDKKRLCTIVDKFRGTLRVYVTKFTTETSDAHVGLTIFTVSCSVQDLGFVVPKKDLSKATANDLTSIKKSMQNNEGALKNAFPDIGMNDLGGQDKLTLFEKGVLFVDNALNEFSEIIMDALEIKAKLFEPLSVIKAKIARTQRLLTTILTLKDTPKQFIDEVTSIIDEVVATQEIVYDILKPFDFYLYEPKINGKTQNEMNIFEKAGLSQIEKDELHTKDDTYVVANTLTLIKNYQLIINTTALTEEEWRYLIDLTLFLLEKVEFTTETADAMRLNILQASNARKKIFETVYVIADPVCLARIVYDITGSLDRYEEIREKNNLFESDYVYGELVI